MQVLACSRVALVGLSLALANQRLVAQRVAGVVRDSASREPIAGAVVTSLDSAGGVTSRTITGVDGRFRISIAGDGRRIQVLRIGFRPRVLALQTPATDTTIDVSMTAVATLLETFTVLEQPNCSKRSDRSTALAAWEQARAGLLASVVARDANPAIIRTLLYDRTLNVGGTRIDSQTVADSTFISSQAARSAKTATEFATAGYLEETSTRRRYYAPDADVLLDPTFAATHCFSLRESSLARPGELGLEFEPARERDNIVDVAGVLWIDRRVPALRSLEFHFTGLEPAASAVGSGGETVFREMRNGVVVVERWNLHIASLSRPFIRLGVPIPKRARDNARRVTGMHDIGGELVEASWLDSTSWHASLGILRGRVVSADDGASRTDVVVRIDHTSLMTVTDSAGRFSFENVLPGPYTVSAADTVLAVYGVAQGKSATVLAARDSVRELTLALPNRAAAVATVCKAGEQGQPSPASERLVLGHVVLANGLPAASANVRAKWFPHDASVALREQTFSGTTDSTGAFSVCGVQGQPVSFRAWRDSLVAIDTTLDIARQSVIAHVTLRLLSPDAAHLPGFRRRVLSISDETSGQPLRDVDVSDLIAGAEIGRTSTSGAIGLAALPLGRTALQLRKLGYANRVVLVDVSPTDSTPVKVTMSTVTSLAAVKVVANATASTRASHNGYEDRRRRGIGRFAEGKELEKAGPSLSDPLIRLGLTPVVHGSATYLAGGHARHPGPALSSSGNRPCFVTVYLDGVLFFEEGSGGEPPDFGHMMTREFAAVEYFSSAAETPVEYEKTGSGCGVLLLWTKD